MKHKIYRWPFLSFVSFFWNGARKNSRLLSFLFVRIWDVICLWVSCLFRQGVLVTKSSSKHCENALKCRIWTRWLMSKRIHFYDLNSFRNAKFFRCLYLKTFGGQRSNCFNLLRWNCNMFEEKKYGHGWCLYFWEYDFVMTRCESSWFSRTVFHFEDTYFFCFTTLKRNERKSYCMSDLVLEVNVFTSKSDFR